MWSAKEQVKYIKTMKYLYYCLYRAEAKKMLSFYQFIYFNWRLITLQYCNGFCHTLT